MDNDEVIAISTEPSLTLKLTKVVVTSLVAYFASDFAGRAFDKVVESRNNTKQEND